MSLKTTSAAIIDYLEARFAELGSEGNSISVTIDSNAPWWIADREHPYSKAAEQAVLDECGVSGTDKLKAPDGDLHELTGETSDPASMD